MAPLKVSAELQAAIEAVTNKRARVALDHIVEHGYVTGADLQAAGYSEYRRAIMDCRDLGFAIKQTPSPAGGGRRAWTLDLDAAQRAGRTGRKNFSKAFRVKLLSTANGHCEVCGASQADRSLQVDHRIPYEIDPGSGDEVESEYQMLCPSCNRSKSWTCESECPNWEARDPRVCATCMWASPDDYRHIATEERRQVTITWDGVEGVSAFERLSAEAEEAGLSPADYLRERLR